MSDVDQRRDRSLTYLYERNQSKESQHWDDEFDEAMLDEYEQENQSGLDDSRLTALDWLAETRSIFPQSTAEYLQREAIERYGLTQLLSDRDVLKAAEPNMQLVQTLLSFRNHLPPEIMHEVRAIIRKVCDDLEQALAQKVMSQFSSRRVRFKHGGTKQLSNIDWLTTIKRNLKHYDVDSRQLLLERLFLYQRESNKMPWHLYVVVDQSGSMLESVIHSAVIAAIFCKVRALRTNLVLFDTQIVDLSEATDDPVETLLSVQLGGGTLIANALTYVRSKISQPNRSIVVLVSDFCEGGPIENLLDVVRELRDDQVSMLGLAALDGSSEAHYDHYVAEKLVELSMPIATMTPDHLARWVAEKVSRN